MSSESSSLGGLFAGLSLSQGSPTKPKDPPVETRNDNTTDTVGSTDAPVTDKLLGLLGTSEPHASPVPASPKKTTAPSPSVSPGISFQKALPPKSPPQRKLSHASKPGSQSSPVAATTTTEEGYVVVEKKSVPEDAGLDAPKLDHPEKEAEEDAPVTEEKSASEAAAVAPEPESVAPEPVAGEEENPKPEPETTASEAAAVDPPAEDMAPAIEDPAKSPEAAIRVSGAAAPRDAMVDAAFQEEEQRRRSKKPTKIGTVHPDTPIPNCDASLRLMRKFAAKTRPKISVDHGGSKSNGILGFFLGRTETEASLLPYAELMKIIIVPEDEAEAEDSNAVVDSIMGSSGDSMAKARVAMATFCHLLSVWCHASTQLEVQKNSLAMELLAVCIDTATDLVAHGCMDNVVLQLGDAEHKAVQMLSEAVFVTDLHNDRIELATLKFLLTTGCRSTPEGDALLRGTHLLQAIRVLYHVYLTTPTKSNKTTARASLQQLVTSVFKRMIATPGSQYKKDPEGFPSSNHRDGFLVLRSMCKLSMRSLPHQSMKQEHAGIQTSNSNVMWDGATKDGNQPRMMREGETPLTRTEQVQGVTSYAVHPALESKVLALELLLYVLQNTDMSGSFLQTSGPQFQYAVRNYLCVSLLKNCTSTNTNVVNLSLRLFVPLVRNFRSHLKTEIEAFVTNVFFVILDSRHSTIEHKTLVVVLFKEICSDPQTLAEIFLNYDCDLSAVDLFHRIVNTLARVAKTGIQDEATVPEFSFVAGAGAARMEKTRNETRQLRLDAMRSLRQVLASLHSSITETKPVMTVDESEHVMMTPKKEQKTEVEETETPPVANGDTKKSLVEIYDSKKKRREEESQAVLRFNQKPTKGIKYAAECGHVDASDPGDVARYLLKNKDVFDKTQTGEYLGREPDYQDGFSLKVLHAYVNMMDFSGMLFDDAIKYFLSGFRLPGEAQKIDRIMEKFAQRYTEQNPKVFPTADVAFILAFSIIMLNTDLHNPAIKEERRMTREGFVRNNRGICDGKDLPEQLLTDIFDRIKSDPISLKEDDEARERAGEPSAAIGGVASIQAALSPSVFFSSHYTEMDRDRENNFQKERDHIVRTTESLLRRKRGTSTKEESQTRRQRSSKKAAVRFVRTEESGLRDEYVAPMFDVTWGPALAAFSTAMESANGTMGALIAIATDEELELAAENAAETIEVCLTGFKYAVCTAGLCGNETARDAYMLALYRFTQLGTGTLLELRHMRCIQTLLSLGKDDGELLGKTWEHVFKALSEINRYHELFQLMARNDRAAAAAAERRRKRLEERERRRKAREERLRATEASETESTEPEMAESDVESFDSQSFGDEDDLVFDEEMDPHEIDDANARAVYDAVSEEWIETIYQRSSSLSSPAIKDFVFQLCRVSRMEISGYGGHAASRANLVDLSQQHYRQQHTLVNSNGMDQQQKNQPNIYNLQKLVEVTHYNMDSRPRLVFSDIWATVAAHLTSTALHSNAAVAMHAVDSFRQLSIQFLQRAELGGFEFQRKFLKPFETVMARSEHSSIKELLLKCVERIILMFGVDQGESGEVNHATLRSGWKPVLSVLGLAGQDADENVARVGLGMLTDQLRQCLSVEKDGEGIDKPRAGVMLAERFVDLVDALLAYVAGPHEKMSVVCIDHLVTLSTFLADESFAMPLVRGKAVTEGETDKNKELELWWPILLGLSRSIGDVRKQVRLKSLVTLLGIINQHFFPQENEREPQESDIQTLQLVFRGILIPVLEHAETDAPLGPPPPLPEDFERFTTKASAPVPKEKRNLTWLETTFEHFMDGCIALCQRSVDAFGEDTLVEEVFAMLNSCLQSDCGPLAVRGLRRLKLFITKDLKQSIITDDTWATACHMLRRCLSVRGLPQKKAEDTTRSLRKEEGESAKLTESEFDVEDIVEFVAEERVLADRRYIGSNVTLIIGNLLSDEKVSEKLGMRWRIFLTSGLGRAVLEWEEAGAMLAEHAADIDTQYPPSYIENAIYGRKWISKLVLQLTSIDQVMASFQSDTEPTPTIAAAQSLIGDQIHSLLTLFLTREASLSSHATATTKAPSWEASQQTRVIKLVLELVASLDAMKDDQLYLLSWLAPMLESCVGSKNETVRKNVERILKRLQSTAAAPTQQEEAMS